MKKESKNYRKAVFVIIYKKVRGKILYLLLKRKLHWKGWEFPKGGIKKGEGELGAIKREIKEEIRLKPIRIIKFNVRGKYRYNLETKKDRGFVGQTYSLYSAEVCDEKIKIDKKEHFGFKWLEFKKALRLLTWKDQKDCLTIIEKSMQAKNKNLYKL